MGCQVSTDGYKLGFFLFVCQGLRINMLKGNSTLLADVAQTPRYSTRDHWFMTYVYHNKSSQNTQNKILSNFLKTFFNSLICHFSVQTLGYFFYKNQNYYFQWKHKKTGLKSTILMAVFKFFFLCSPDCPKQPRIEYPFYRFLYPMFFGAISEWVREILWIMN